MAQQEIHQNDVGTTLTVTIADEGTAVNISAAATKVIKLTKPDGTVLSKSASFTTDGTDGKMYWVAVSGDFDTVGPMRIQGVVTFSGGVQYSSEIKSFPVHSNLT